MVGKYMPHLFWRNRAKSQSSQSKISGVADFGDAAIGAIDIKKSCAPRKMDFERGAREFRKKQLNASLVKGTTEAAIITAVILMVLTTAGLMINKKYQGRSLPFTYVGNVSIGGKTKEQIKILLDQHFAQMNVTFNEGGLQRQASLGQLGISIDTKSLSEQAIPGRLSPLAFLNWQRLNAKVNMSDKFIAGYVALHINASQTKAQDAKLIINKNQLIIQPEIVGFKSDGKAIAQQIKYALASANVPIIDVTTITAKPSVKSKDLTDDLSHINSLLQTPVSVKIGYTTIKPTLKQKLAWLSLNQQPGAINVGADFSKGLIRSYILDQVKKYQPPTNGVVVDNIDEVTDSLATALKNGVQASEQLSIKSLHDSTVPPDPGDTIASR